MLRANVGLSRKVSRDYQSTGFTVNLDGEIPFSVDDPDAILEKIKELFNLAQEALGREIDRDQGETAIGRRDDEPAPAPANGKNGSPNGQPQGQAAAAVKTEPQSNGTQQNGSRNGTDEGASNKQVQFILTMGKRFKLSTPQLEGRINQIIGRKCGVYDLTKKEAGRVLDQFTNGNGQSKQQAGTNAGN